MHLKLTVVGYAFMNMDDFARWMETAPDQRRVEAASALAHAYFQPALPTEQRRRILHAMTLLTDDRAVSVRRSLAEALTRYDQPPKVLLTALLNDVPSVAIALIARSPALDQADMVNIINSAEPATSSALGARAGLSPAIISAIARAGVREGILALLSNLGARLAQVDFADIAKRLGTDGLVRGALLLRPDLPAQVRDVLVTHVAQDLKQLVTDRAWMSPERSRRMIREAGDKAVVNVAKSIESRELRDYISTLNRDGRITPALLIRALASGPDGLFEAALGELANAPVARVREVVESGHPTAIVALLGKAGLSERLQKAFAIALDHRDGDWAGMDRQRRTAIMLERLMTAAETELEGDTDDMVALLRRMNVEARRDDLAAVEARDEEPAPRKLARISVMPTRAERLAPDASPAPRMLHDRPPIHQRASASSLQPQPSFEKRPDYSHLDSTLPAAMDARAAQVSSKDPNAGPRRATFGMKNAPRPRRA